MSKHTPGPWKVEAGRGWKTGTRSKKGEFVRTLSIIGNEYDRVSGIGGTILDETDDANARRIVECVNACEGIENPAAVRALILAAKAVMMARLPALNFDLSGHPDMAALDEALHLLGVK